MYVGFTFAQLLFSDKICIPALAVRLGCSVNLEPGLSLFSRLSPSGRDTGENLGIRLPSKSKPLTLQEMRAICN